MRLFLSDKLANQMQVTKYGSMGGVSSRSAPGQQEDGPKMVKLLTKRPLASRPGLHDLMASKQVSLIT